MMKYLPIVSDVRNSMLRLLMKSNKPRYGDRRG